MSYMLRHNLEESLGWNDVGIFEKLVLCCIVYCRSMSDLGVESDSK
jgi:hypothetical protein